MTRRSGGGSTSPIDLALSDGLGPARSSSGSGEDRPGGVPSSGAAGFLFSHAPPGASGHATRFSHAPPGASGHATRFSSPTLGDAVTLDGARWHGGHVGPREGHLGSQDGRPHRDGDGDNGNGGDGGDGGGDGALLHPGGGAHVLPLPQDRPHGHRHRAREATRAPGRLSRALTRAPFSRTLSAWARVLRTRPELVAVSLVYLVQGLLGLSKLAVFVHLKDAVGLQPDAVAGLTGLTMLPWMIKPLYGFLSDAVPLFGYRRKSYLVLCGALGSASWLLLAVSPASAALALLFLTLSAVATSAADVVADSLVVEATHDGPPEQGGTLQSLCWAWQSAGRIVAAAAAGPAVAALGARGAFALTALCPALVALAAISVTERRIIAGGPAAGAYDGAGQGEGGAGTGNWAGVAIAGGGRGRRGMAARAADAVIAWTSRLSSLFQEALPFSLGGGRRQGQAQSDRPDDGSVPGGVNDCPAHGEDELAPLRPGASAPGDDRVGAYEGGARDDRWARDSGSGGVLDGGDRIDAGADPASAGASAVVYPTAASFGSRPVPPRPLPPSPPASLVALLRQQAKALSAAFLQPRIWRPTLFAFLWNATPVAETALTFFQTERLGFSAGFLGTLQLVAALANLLGVAVFDAALRRTSLRAVFLGSGLAASAISASQLILVTGANRTLGIPDRAFALVDSAIITVIGQVAFMPVLVLGARLCPEGVEASLFATLMSVMNAGTATGASLGAALTGLLGVTRTDFSRLPLLVTLCTLLSLAPLPLLPILLPHEDGPEPELPAVPRGVGERGGGGDGGKSAADWARGRESAAGGRGGGGERAEGWGDGGDGLGTPARAARGDGHPDAAAASLDDARLELVGLRGV